MPASPRSLRLVDLFRLRLDAIRIRVERDTERHWREQMPQDLDTEEWIGAVTRLVSAAQTEATRATSGFLAAYLSFELGRRTTVPEIDSRRYAGFSRDGRPLSEALRSPLIGTKAALGEGRSLQEALEVGLQRAMRMVELDTLHASRTALMDAIDADDRFDGWQRATSGTCGACAAVAGRHEHGLMFAVHPSCKCVAAPVVRGVSNRFVLPTGTAIFAAKTKDEQDEMLGPETAELVRTGQVSIEQLAGESELESDAENFITQKPLVELR